MKNYSRQIFDLVEKANPNDPISFTVQAVKPLAIEKLNEAIENCRDCKIGQSDHCFKTISRGNENASVLMLYDFPVRPQKNLRKGVLKVYENVEEWNIMQKIISAYHINQTPYFL